MSLTGKSSRRYNFTKKRCLAIIQRRFNGMRKSKNNHDVMLSENKAEQNCLNYLYHNFV
jgi:hypothetical protein